MGGIQNQIYTTYKILKDLNKYIEWDQLRDEIVVSFFKKHTPLNLTDIVSIAQKHANFNFIKTSKKKKSNFNTKKKIKLNTDTKKIKLNTNSKNIYIKEVPSNSKQEEIFFFKETKKIYIDEIKINLKKENFKKPFSRLNLKQDSFATRLAKETQDNLEQEILDEILDASNNIEDSSSFMPNENVEIKTTDKPPLDEAMLHGRVLGIMLKYAGLKTHQMLRFLPQLLIEVPLTVIIEGLDGLISNPKAKKHVENGVLGAKELLKIAPKKDENVVSLKAIVNSLAKLLKSNVSLVLVKNGFIGIRAGSRFLTKRTKDRYWLTPNWVEGKMTKRLGPDTEPIILNLAVIASKLRIQRINHHLLLERENYHPFLIGFFSKLKSGHPGFSLKADAPTIDDVAIENCKIKPALDTCAKAYKQCLDNKRLEACEVAAKSGSVITPEAAAKAAAIAKVIKTEGGYRKIIIIQKRFVINLKSFFLFFYTSFKCFVKKLIGKYFKPLKELLLKISKKLGIVFYSFFNNFLMFSYDFIQNILKKCKSKLTEKEIKKIINKFLLFLIFGFICFRIRLVIPFFKNQIKNSIWFLKKLKHYIIYFDAFLFNKKNYIFLKKTDFKPLVHLKKLDFSDIKNFGIFDILDFYKEKKDFNLFIEIIITITPIRVIKKKYLF